jgi:hypothetical protein
MRVMISNETADRLARTGSEHPFIGPELACGISIGVAKKAVRDWTNKQRREIRNWIQDRQRDLY